MPRGRQYYDPIVQVPSLTDRAQDFSRIEFYLDEDLKWKGRLIAPDGSVAAVAPGDFDHDGALEQARRLWGDLAVYELTGPQVDSTWNGQGPSPRLWQQPGQVREERQEVEEVIAAAEPAPVGEADTPGLHCMTIAEPGLYVRVDELCALLGHWANQYEEDRNPSAAVALREAASALLEIK